MQRRLYENVGGLDVPVTDALLVDLRQCLARLPHLEFDQEQRQLRFVASLHLEDSLQCFGHEVHHDVQLDLIGTVASGLEGMSHAYYLRVS